jgi:hypothetical protein
MQRQSVVSSNVQSIGYDKNSQILEVAFLNGSVYQYFGVPAVTYRGLMSANSHGSYLHAHVKGRYSYKRVR